MTDSERVRGVLSAADRDFLADAEAHSRQLQYARKDAIETRIWNSFLDFETLRRSREGYDSFAAIDSLLEDGDIDTHRELETSLINMVTFVYGVCHHLDIRFEQMVESGVYEAYPEYRPNHILRGVDVEIDDEGADMMLKTARHDWQSGGSLSPHEAAALMQSDKFDDGDLPELRERVRQQHDESSALKHERENPDQPAIASPPDDEQSSWSDTSIADAIPDDAPNIHDRKDEDEDAQDTDESD